MRVDGRKFDELRSIEIIPNWTENPDGSVLVKWGRTWVLCTASAEYKSPRWQKEKNEGWVTGEYGMLPGSTDTRKRRPGLRPDSRGTEIKRLIGRSLRGACDLSAIPGWTISVDCDVLQADGGTRVASITGGMIALSVAAESMVEKGLLASVEKLVREPVVAISLGIVGEDRVLDLNYKEDSTAEVDLNLVGTLDGKCIEVQGTSEGRAMEKKDLDDLLELGFQGLSKVSSVVKPFLKR